jgi:flagellar hook-associated protein 1 FlgK
LFTDINDQSMQDGRVLKNSNNAYPYDRELRVEIADISKITASDYELSFDGPTNNNYILTRKRDGETVMQGTLSGVYPVTLEVDGLDITLESGSFQLNDTFLIQPTRDAALELSRVVNRTQELAYALPISTGSNLGNIGNGSISQGEMLATTDPRGDTLAAFAVPGQLSPPIVVRFTSATTYDVLDNTDPANPVDLNPPMRGRKFTANLQNPVFSRSEYQTSVFTDPANALNATTRTAGGGALNGYPTETVTVTMTDPGSGIPTTVSANLGLNESARLSALKLSQLPNVSAFADTSATLQITDPGGVAQNISLNGVDLTNPALGSIPSPMTADFLRDRINDDPGLAAQGIKATSDGANLSVRSATGEDLRFQLNGGAPGSSLLITEMNGEPALGATAIGIGGASTVGGILMVDMQNSGILVSSLAAPGGRFSTPAPTVVNSFSGYQVVLSGTPEAGDEFTVNYNTDGTADNRNAATMARLQTDNVIDGETLSFQDAYGQMIGDIGSKTSQIRSNAEAAESLLAQSQGTRDSLSGVNLDEEAARLIHFEQAYNAAAQVVSIAQQTFDALIGAMR